MWLAAQFVERGHDFRRVEIHQTVLVSTVDTFGQRLHHARGDTLLGDFDRFGVCRVAVKHVGNMERLTRVADVMRKNAGGTHQALRITCLHCTYHLVIDLPATEWD